MTAYSANFKVVSCTDSCHTTGLMHWQLLHNLTPVRSSRQWYHDDWLTVSVIWRNCSTFIFRVKQIRIKENFLHYLTLMMKALSFETLDTHHLSQHHIPKELNLQQVSYYKHSQSPKKFLLHCLTITLQSPTFSPPANNHVQPGHTVCKFQNRIPSIQQTT
jgi:hypothetical protein